MPPKNRKRGKKLARAERPASSASGAVRSRRGAWAWVWFLVLCAGVFVCLPGMLSGNFLPKSVWMWSLLGLILLLPQAEAPREKDEATHSLSLLGVVWLAINAWILISFLWSEQPRVALDRWISIPLFATAVHLAARRTRFWRAKGFWQGFCGIIATLGLLGLLQWKFPEAPALAWIPSTGLPSATLGNRNYAGLYLALTLPFAYWAFFAGRLRSAWAAIPPSLAVALGSLFLLMTRTRGAWIALVLAAMWLAALGVLRPLLRRRARLAFLGGLIGLAVVVASLSGPGQAIMTHGMSKMPQSKEDLWSTVTSIVKDTRTNPRLRIWKVLLLTKPNPLLGAGYGSFPIAATPHHPDGMIYTLNWELHNDYFEAYAEGGVPLTAGLAALYALLILRGVRGRRKGIVLAASAAMLAFAAMEALTFVSQKLSTIAWAAAVSAILCEETPSLTNWRWKPNLRRLAPLGRVLLGVASLGIALAAWSSVGADRDLQGSLRRAQLTGTAPDLTRLSEETLPGLVYDMNARHLHAHTYAGLALRAQNFSAARRFATEAVRLQPRDHRSLEVRASAAGRLGDWRTAAESLERVVEIKGSQAPPRVWSNLSACYQRLGRMDEAAEAAARAESAEARGGP